MFTEIKRTNERQVEEINQLNARLSRVDDDMEEYRKIITDRENTIQGLKARLSAQYNVKNAEVEITERGEITVVLHGPWMPKDWRMIAGPFIKEIDLKASIDDLPNRQRIAEEEKKEAEETALLLQKQAAERLAKKEGNK